MKAVIKFNKSNPTVRQRMDVNQLKESHVVDLELEKYHKDMYWLTYENNTNLPWTGGHRGMVSYMGNDIRFEVIMTK